MHLEDNVLTLQPCEEPAVTWTVGKVKAGCLGKAAQPPPLPLHSYITALFLFPPPSCSLPHMLSLSLYLICPGSKTPSDSIYVIDL